MRKFSEFEENIIKKMVAAKDIKETSLAKLIDENTPCIAMEWDEVGEEFTIFHLKSIENSGAIFIKIQEIIYLLKVLEDEKYIFTHHNKKYKNTNSLFNQAKYQHTDAQYRLKKDNPDGLGVFFPNKITVYSDFGELVQYFAGSLFYITFALRDLVDNDFKTPEQKRFEEQLEVTDTNHNVAMRKAQKQVNIAWGAFCISLLTLLYTLNNETTINHSQLDQIKQSIEQKALPAVFKTEITNDTLTTKVVEMPKVKSTIQSK